MKKKTLTIIVAVVIFAGLSYAAYSFNHNDLRYVSISINPDVQLAVNENNIVEEVVPTNEDADVITSDLDLVGKNLDEASEDIIDAAIETGYIDEYNDENVVAVTAIDEDEEARKELEDKVVTKLNGYFAAKGINPVVVTNGVTEEIKAEAEKYDISNGKMLLINRAVTVNSNLSKDDLAVMSVKEIQKEIKDAVTARHEALKISKTELQTKWVQEKATLRETYKNKVEALKAELLKNSGVNTANMTDAEKTKAATDALNARKAQIKEKANRIKTELENTIEDKSYPAIRNTIKNIKNRIGQGTV